MEAKYLSEVSEGIKIYNDYKESERVSSKNFHTPTWAMLNQLQVQEPKYSDNDGSLAPEEFQVLEPTPEETEKLEYVV